MKIVRGMEEGRKALAREPLSETQNGSPEILEGIRRIFGEDLTPSEAVSRIISAVSTRGDDAVKEYSALIDQAPGEFRERPTLRIDFTVHHVVTGQAEYLTLLDQYLNVPRNTRVHQLVADFPHIRSQKLGVAGKQPHVTLVDDEVKVVDLYRLTVPMLPKEANGLARKFSLR